MGVSRPNARGFGGNVALGISASAPQFGFVVVSTLCIGAVVVLLVLFFSKMKRLKTCFLALTKIFKKCSDALVQCCGCGNCGECGDCGKVCANSICPDGDKSDEEDQG